MDGRLKLLVVDDDPVNRTLVSKRLEGMGHQVDTADDGVQGLERVAETSYDAVISDLVMPGGVDGLTLLEMCVARRPAPAVILMTAQASVDTAVDAMKRGASDYLEKPVNFEEVRVRLNKIAVMGSLARDADQLREAIEATEESAAETVRSLEELVETALGACHRARSILGDQESEPEQRIHRALDTLSAVV